MATAVQIPLAEYLQTTYRPDCEYLDGELRERNAGKWQHGRIQSLLAAWFAQHESAWHVIAGVETRMAVSPDRIRIADVAIVPAGSQPDVLIEPPVLVIEILSPGDTYTELEIRCRDYLGMGVQTIWIIDPTTRSGRMCQGAQWLAAERLEVPGNPIFVSLERLFSRMEGSADTL